MSIPQRPFIRTVSNFSFKDLHPWLYLDLDSFNTEAAYAFVGPPVALAPNASIVGANIVSAELAMSGVLDPLEYLEILYGGVTYAIGLGVDGETILYGLIDEPDFVLSSLGNSITVTAPLANVARWQDFLRSITYKDLTDPGTSGVRTITIVLTGASFRSSNAAVVTLAVGDAAKGYAVDPDGNRAVDIDGNYAVEPDV